MAIAPSAAMIFTASVMPNSSSPSRFSSLSSSGALISSNRANLGLLRSRSRSVGSTRRKGLSCNCLFGLGVPEMVVIAGVAALVFGPKQLPEVGRSIGKTVKSFQQAAKEFESELKKEPESSLQPPAGNVTAVREEEKQQATASSTENS